MKNKIILTLTFLIFIGVQSIISQNKNCSLRIEINDIKSNKGQILLKLISLDKDFSVGKVAIISNQKCEIRIDSLDCGNYVINYFHDENSNNTLDTNWLGIPNEGYGFSNNAVASFGSPSLEERKFKLAGNVEMKLTPKY